jgi:superfamily II DNA helicase RecQ
MQIKTFSIPVDSAASEEAEMNRFLRGHRILNVAQHFLEMGAASRWAYSVEYMETRPAATAEKSVGKTGRIDYKEVLDAPAFALFAKLRDLRKELSVTAAVPAYAVFTNEQLAAMVAP